MAFMVDEDGLLRDESAYAQTQRMLRRIAWGDPLAFEASVMITRANQAHVKSMSPILEELELSGARFSVLRVLSSAQGHRLLMGEIAKSLAVTPTNVTRLVAGLVRDGLVKRITPQEDHRAAYIELTEEGHERFSRAVPLRQQKIREDFSALSTEEKRLLIHLLTKVLANHLGRTEVERLDLEAALSPSKLSNTP